MNKDRALGSFIGLAVGDALGTTVEFMDRDTFPPVTGMVGGGPFELNPGEWTDDTSMALCLADTLIESDFATTRTLDQKRLLDSFARWYYDGHNSVNGRCFDIGNTTRKAIQTFRTRGRIGGYDDRSIGNGGIMRLSPAVIASVSSSRVAIQTAIDQSYTTHAHPICLACAETLAAILWAQINGADIPPVENPYLIRDVAHLRRDQISSSGYALHTLEAAVWAVDTSESFSEAVLKAVNLGDDADTVGAVAGQIAGSKWGLSGIPSEWVEALAWKDRLLTLGEKLFALGTANVQRATVLKF